MDGSIPGDAPALLWIVILAAVALWWLWPWLDRFLWSVRVEPTPGAQSASGASAADYRAEQAAAEVLEQELVEQTLEENSLVAAPLGFDPLEEFDRVFAQVVDHVRQLLDVPPVGAESAAANAAIHKTAAVLDRIFESWGNPQELARVSQLQESSEAFVRTFGGTHRIGSCARQLLQTAGFEEQTGEKVWIFHHEEALSRLRAMTVRLCLRRVAELQKLRGTMRWVQANNEHVVPKLGDGSLPDLLTLCLETRSKMQLPAEPSQRERAVEFAVRAKVGERRSEEGCSIALLSHDGLTAAARALAYTQRKRVREGGNVKPPRPVDTEVQNLLMRTPLPPGFDAAHLHFCSDELPHIFGLASTRGGGNSDGCGTATAEILANEAVGFWATKQAADLAWNCATICGIGAALDYTVNRGFVVVLLVGYEGVPPCKDEDGAIATASSELRRRRAAANAASQAPGGAAALPKSRSFGAKVQTLGTSSASGFTNSK